MLDVLHALRNRLLGSERFRRWSARVPVTRGIARRQARALFDLCAGFVYSQVLLACVRLGVLERLSGRAPQTLAALAAELELPEPAAARLLEAARALRLVERRGPKRYGLGPLGAALIGNPGVLAMIEHNALLYADLADPVALLRRGKGAALPGYWPYANASAPALLDAAAVAPYSELMARSQALLATLVLDAHPFRRHRCLLDVGGGEGAFLRAVAERVPRLQLLLFDLPAVVARARDSLAASSLLHRVELFAGDFLRDPLPRDADLVTLVRVLHDHDDESALRLLRAVRDAIADDGVLLVAEPMADTGGAEPVGAAYFGCYLFAMGQGRSRSAAELSALLRAAGFRDVRRVATSMPLLASVLTARPASAASVKKR